MQLLVLCLTTKESQMVVQLAMPKSSRDTLGIPITGDPLPAIFLWLKLHEPCHNDTHTQTRKIRACRLPVLIVRDRDMLDASGGAPEPAAHGSGGQRMQRIGGDHCSDYNAFVCQFAKSLQPTHQEQGWQQGQYCHRAQKGVAWL